MTRIKEIRKRLQHVALCQRHNSNWSSILAMASNTPLDAWSTVMSSGSTKPKRRNRNQPGESSWTCSDLICSSFWDSRSSRAACATAKALSSRFTRLNARLVFDLRLFAIERDVGWWWWGEGNVCCCMLLTHRLAFSLHRPLNNWQFINLCGSWD